MGFCGRKLYQRRFEKQPITACVKSALSTGLYQRRFEKQPITLNHADIISDQLYQRRFEKQPITVLCFNDFNL